MQLCFNAQEAQKRNMIRTRSYTIENLDLQSALRILARGVTTRMFGSRETAFRFFVTVPPCATTRSDSVGRVRSSFTTKTSPGDPLQLRAGPKRRLQL